MGFWYLGVIRCGVFVVVQGASGSRSVCSGRVRSRMKCFGVLAFALRAQENVGHLRLRVLQPGLGWGLVFSGCMRMRTTRSYKMVAGAFSNRVGVFGNRCSISRVGVVPHSCKVGWKVRKTRIERRARFLNQEFLTKIINKYCRSLAISLNWGAPV